MSSPELRRPADRELAVIVVNYASHQLIEQNLGAVRLDCIDARVIVVDNFSSVEETEAIHSLAQRMGWHIVDQPVNKGFGSGVNAGIRAASELGSRSFLLINPDARIDREAVRELHRECLSQPLAMVAPRVVGSDGSIYFDGAVIAMRTGRIRGISAVSDICAGPRGLTGVIDGRRQPVEPWLTGACVAFSRELIERISGVDEDFFLYWEDVDLSYRARQAGATLIIRHDITVTHDEGGTQGETLGRAKSELYYFYNCRNRLVFAARRLAPGTVGRWLLHTPAVSWKILMQGGKRQLLRSLRPLVCSLQGSSSGIWVALRSIFVSGTRVVADALSSTRAREEL